MCVCVQQLLLLFDSRSDDFVPQSVLQSRILPRNVGGGETTPAPSIPHSSPGTF